VRGGRGGAERVKAQRGAGRRGAHLARAPRGGRGAGATRRAGGGAGGARPLGRLKLVLLVRVVVVVTELGGTLAAICGGNRRRGGMSAPQRSARWGRATLWGAPPSRATRPPTALNTSNTHSWLWRRQRVRKGARWTAGQAGDGAFDSKKGAQAARSASPRGPTTLPARKEWQPQRHPGRQRAGGPHCPQSSWRPHHRWPWRTPPRATEEPQQDAAQNWRGPEPRLCPPRRGAGRDRRCAGQKWLPWRGAVLVRAQARSLVADVI
jgi:hypothetical protein